MLREADASIVLRDAGLLGLSTLMNEDAFCDSLRRMAPRCDIRSASARYVRYKPGTSCLVAYEVVLADQVVDVYARCHAEDRVVKVSNARQRLEVTGPLGHGLLTDPHAGIAVFVYPNDYEIKSLRKLFERDRTPRRLRRMLPAHPHLQESVPSVLRYKPERRFVCKMEGPGGPPAALRLYSGSRYPEMRERAWAFKNSDGLNLPRLVGDSERYASLAYEWVEGFTPNGEMLRTDDAMLTRIAQALGALHRQRPRLSTLVTAHDYCRGAISAREMLTALDGSFGRRAGEQIAALHDSLCNGLWRPHAVHGDFTIDQILISANGVTLLDFDRAGYAEPAMDIGTFTANQLARAVMKDTPKDEALECGACLVAAYRREGGQVDPVTVQACTAFALLMLAPEPFRNRAADWPDRIEQILESVDRVLAQEVIDA